MRIIANDNIMATVVRELRDRGLHSENRNKVIIRFADQVEPRREFIQKHALDVRNLDV